MPTIAVEINQEKLRGGQKLPRTVLDRVLRVVDRMVTFRKDTTVSVAFVSEREIRRLNKTYRGKDQVTDVLSFSLDRAVDPSGEILICYEQAVRQAKEMGHSTRDEVVFLLVHGLLHIFGFDHERPVDAKKMFPLQEKILEKLGIDSRL